VATDIIGVSGRAMLEALVAGTHDPAVLAALAKGRLRSKLPALREALAGRFRAAWARRVALPERQVAQALRLLRPLPSGVSKSHQTTHSWLRMGPHTGLSW
jgi:transposase